MVDWKDAMIISLILLLIYSTFYLMPSATGEVSDACVKACNERIEQVTGECNARLKKADASNLFLDVAKFLLPLLI